MAPNIPSPPTAAATAMPALAPFERPPASSSLRDGVTVGDEVARGVCELVGEEIVEFELNQEQERIT